MIERRNRRMGHRENQERLDQLASIVPASREQTDAWNRADLAAGRAPHQITKDMPRRWPW